jgi:hypothetical protein
MNPFQQNGHSMIDSLIQINDAKNQIDPSTINRTMHGNYGNNMMAMYEALTKGGEKRNIQRYMPSIGTKENFQLMDELLRQEVGFNPNFSDTVKVEDLQSAKDEVSWMAKPDMVERLTNYISSLFGK